jgi:hypothetical protein
MSGRAEGSNRRGKLSRSEKVIGVKLTKIVRSGGE